MMMMMMMIQQKPLRLLFPAPVLVDLVHCLTEIMSGPGDLPGECVLQQQSRDLERALCFRQQRVLTLWEGLFLFQHNASGHKARFRNERFSTPVTLWCISEADCEPDPTADISDDLTDTPVAEWEQNLSVSFKPGGWEQINVREYVIIRCPHTLGRVVYDTNPAAPHFSFSFLGFIFLFFFFLLSLRIFSLKPSVCFPCDWTWRQRSGSNWKQTEKNTDYHVASHI